MITKSELARETARREALKTREDPPVLNKSEPMITKSELARETERRRYANNVRLFEESQNEVSELPTNIQSPEVPPVEDEGFFSNLRKGARYGYREDLPRQANILSGLLVGQEPEGVPVTPSPELGFDRKSIGQFIGRQATSALPSIGATLGGTLVGSAAGSAVPVVGNVIGGIAGGAVGAGVTAAGQTLADVYNEARLKGMPHEEAISIAKKAAGISGSLNAAFGGLGGIGLKSGLMSYVPKQAAIQGVGGAADVASQNVLARETGLDPERDITQGMKEAIIGNAAFQGVPVAMAVPGIIRSRMKPVGYKMTPTGEPVQTGNVLLPVEGGANLTPPLEQAVPQKFHVEQPNIPFDEASVTNITPVINELAPITELGQPLTPTTPTAPGLGRTLTPEGHLRIQEKQFGNKKVNSWWDKAKKVWNDIDFEQKIFEDIAPIRKMGIEKGIKNPRENKAYRMARFARHPTGTLEAVFFHGEPKWNADSGLIEADTTRPGLIQIVEPILQSPEMLRKFESFAYARRVVSNDLVAKRKEKNITHQEALDILESAKEHPEFEGAFNKLQSYKKQVLDIATETGLINQAQRDVWEGVDHIPFYRQETNTIAQNRIGSKRSLAGQKANIKKLTGGAEQFAVFDDRGRVIDRLEDRAAAVRMAEAHNGTIESVGAPTADIVQNLAENTAGLLQAASRNAAANETIKMGIEGGYVEPITKAESTRSGKALPDVIKTKVNGEDAYFRITDPPLYDALTSTLTPSFKTGIITTGMQLFKNNFSRLTLLNPSTQFKVAVKDLIQCRMMGSYPLPGLFKTVDNMTAAMRHEFSTKKDPRIIEMMAMGADAGYYKNRPEQVLKRVHKMIEGRDITWIDAINYPKKALDAYERLGRAAEMGQRLNKLDAAKKAGATNPEAAFDALDYMDYAQRGSSSTIQWMCKTVPFLSTHLASLHKVGREINANGFNNRTLKVISLVGLASMVNTIVNLRPDESEEDEANNYLAQPEYLRNTKFMVDLYKYIGKEAVQRSGMTRWVMFDKPWMIGFLSMTIPEQFIMTMAGEKNTMDNIDFLRRNLMSQFAFNPAGNPVIKTIYEQWANKQMYNDQPIVPRSREGLEPELQYGPNTGEAEKALGSLTGVSPDRIKHAGLGLLGVAYSWPMVVMNTLMINSPKSALYTSEQPFIKEFFKDGVLKQSGYQEEFYQLSRAADTAYKTMKTYEDLGQVEELEEYVESHKGPLQSRMMLVNIKKQLHTLYDESLKIEQSKDISSIEKRQMIDEINQQRNLILNQVHKMRKSILGKEENE